VLARQILNFRRKGHILLSARSGTHKVLRSVGDNLTSGPIGKVGWKRGRRVPLRCSALIIAEMQP